MHVIVCLDDRQGMLFHKRRQSRDKNLINDVWGLTKELWISPFSESLFSDASGKIKLDKDYLKNAGKGEFCFVEADHVLPYIEKLEKIIVYKWNKQYPADFKFDIPLEHWKLVEQKEIVGTSHEKITRNTYVKG